MSNSSPNPRELKVSLHISAPPAKVWEVMTTRITEWWCPQPWTTQIIAQDWRAGGRCAMTLHGPEGESHVSDGLFLEVTPGVRFVSTDAVMRGRDGSLLPGAAFMIGGWEIAAEGDGTLYTGWARHWTDEALMQHKEMGFEAGWAAVAEQLKALCES